MSITSRDISRKKKAKYMETLVERLSDALNEVGTAFKELNEDL